ncbi:hypothetical protein HanRHA438_Chr03g0121831 [Helianthus annuus]|nr:hypothetical protein HanIR_Chr03g0121221 [Helianthus annuus]KAJ0935637.1 hypothetical protein HanRHA438_Chr03g0121831 [Helianthus annuus]
MNKKLLESDADQTVEGSNAGLKSTSSVFLKFRIATINRRMWCDLSTRNFVKKSETQEDDEGAINLKEERQVEQKVTHDEYDGSKNEEE